MPPRMLHALGKYEAMSGAIEQCDARVLEVLGASTIREARIAAESFKNGGKRLRPALMILCSTVSDGGRIDAVEAPIIDLAAAVELIHLATLFHDDVIDDVETRRAKASARTKYGNFASVLAGDFVLVEALLLVQKSGLVHTMPDFLRTIRVLVQGESRESIHKFDFDVNEAVYYEIISEKSASLFALSCKVGGLGRHSGYSDVLGHFGWSLGMAFQMIDDLDDMLDLPRGMHDSDLKNGYLALPVIRTLGNLRDGFRDELIGIIRSGDFTPENQRRIVGLCRDHGGFEAAAAEIHKHLERAIESIDRFTDGGDARDLLDAIVLDLRAYSDVQIHELDAFASSE
jgi:geranylgeranyl pyrophosphate synthase